MPAIFTVNLRGSKTDVATQIDAQVKDPNANAALKSIMAAAPGNMVSFAGAMNKSSDGTYGNINLNGSFWTK